MRLSRRGLILGCAALTASCAADGVSRPALARPMLAQAPVPLADYPDLAPPLAIQPAAEVVRHDPQGLIRKELLADALAALDKHGSRIAHRDRIYIVDFQRHSSRPRLFKLDLASGQVTAFHTAHGRGSDPAHTGFAQKFSNRPNSYASSVGAYVTAGQSSGSKHGSNVLLEGLDPSNNEAREREIIVHSADYCEPRYLAAQGKLGRSNGCFSVSEADLEVLRPSMDSGRLLFAGI